MKTDSLQKLPSLNMRSIFRCMMEDGYYPTFEQTHIQFNMDDTIAVVEYEDGILSVMVFFSIDEDAYGLFLEASNSTMIETYSVKPTVLDDMKNLLFSCEMLCDNVREFRKFFPRMIAMLNEAISIHKEETRKLILASEIANATIPAMDETMTGTNRKILS